MEFYSHPDKRLIDHLVEVRNISKTQIENKFDKADEIISYCHDFGKYTTYFQDYLFSRKKENNILKNHGFISAVFASYIAFEEFEKNSYMPYIIYNCVLHHHGSIENPAENLPKSLKKIDESEKQSLTDKIYACKKQIEDIKENREFIELDYKSIGYDKYVNDFIDNIKVEEILFKLRRIDHIFRRRNKMEEVYFIHQILYSALISADKLSASNTKIPKLHYTDFQTLNSIKNKKFKDSPKNFINGLRSDIFNNIQAEIVESYDKHKIFSITSPTGTGKTYSGFFAALKLKDLLKDNRKIVYSLPFTSIIDQNYKSIYELLEGVDGFDENISSYIIKHHNLSNVDYKSEKEEYEKTKAELLIENWNSGVVVTTFVQLLQTLIGNRNRMLKKFNSMRGSIILLDEVQAIDIKFYRLVDYILKSAVKYLDCRIIMMTATKPLILQEGHELLKNNEKYFEKFERTNIIPKLEPLTVDDFCDRFISNIEDKSYLIICNTIGQSLDIYKNLSEDLEEQEREVSYLSTNILPIHRRERINEINKKLKNGEKPILVSTQVVEAGVDFDFDVVIRDIAPIDSIIQAAGRCNRNGKREKGEVYVYSMCKDENKKGGRQYFANFVYGKTLINITSDVLNKYDSIFENMYFNIIKDYFDEVNKNINDEASEGFIESIIKLYFTKAGKSEYEDYTISKFSLIKSNPDYMDVYFRIDENAEKVYQDLLKVLSEKDFVKKKQLYLEVKNKIRDYTLSLPSKFNSAFEKWKNGDEKVFLINMPMEGCEDYYDEITGFKREEDEQEFIVF
ncbi:CRISPR-associated helicase Cas3' [Haloimpatiens sp. FM7330]|uniref:CRISPR-associated helicase Cas3' n=1 Tax=Haloimpatiens sp. FM7330 TaxID=3298610 RepID=UPI00362B39EB